MGTAELYSKLKSVINKNKEEDVVYIVHWCSDHIKIQLGGLYSTKTLREIADIVDEYIEQNKN